MCGKKSVPPQPITICNGLAALIRGKTYILRGYPPDYTWYRCRWKSMKVLRMSGIEPSLKDGMITLQRSMEDLCADGLISKEEVKRFAADYKQINPH